MEPAKAVWLVRAAPWRSPRLWRSGPGCWRRRPPWPWPFLGEAFRIEQGLRIELGQGLLLTAQAQGVVDIARPGRGRPDVGRRARRHVGKARIGKLGVAGGLVVLGDRRGQIHRRRGEHHWRAQSTQPRKPRRPAPPGARRAVHPAARKTVPVVKIASGWPFNWTFVLCDDGLKRKGEPPCVRSAGEWRIERPGEHSRDQGQVQDGRQARQGKAAVEAAEATTAKPKAAPVRVQSPASKPAKRAKPVEPSPAAHPAPDRHGQSGGRSGPAADARERAPRWNGCRPTSRGRPSPPRAPWPARR